MGGVYDSIEVEASSRDALYEIWRGIVAHCQYEHGHGGYSGTFAEKPQIRIILPNSSSGTWDKSIAREHCLEHNDKWGAAYAYHLGEQRYYIGGWCSS